MAEQTERPEFPKPLVRLRAVPGGYEAEVKMAADDDAEAAAEAEGFHAVPVPEQPAGFQEYPKWVYHADGRRQVVHTEAEAEALDGFEDTMPEPEDDDAPEGVPSPVGAAAATASPNRPPVPADRG
jgi:hypothetical protein